MTVLEVQKFLRQGGSPQLLKEMFAIDSKFHPTFPLVLFKYNQIESPFNERIVQECRGLILELDTWNVVSRSFDKFFNHGEGNAAQIDWLSATVQEKLDGSLMVLYPYNGTWHVQSSGSPNAGGNVDKSEKTFAELFWETFEKQKLKLPNSNERFCFTFELTGPENRIIIPYDESKLTLIGIRNLDSQKEIGVEWGGQFFNRELPIVRSFDISSFEAAKASFANFSGLVQEGYVVVDGYFNRVKIKHPDYVKYHHAKNEFSTKNFIEVIRTGESNEYLSYFPEHQKIFDELKEKIENLEGVIQLVWETYSPIENQRDFALIANQFPYSSILFCLKNGKYKSVKDGIKEMKIDHLMKLLNV